MYARQRVQPTGTNRPRAWMNIYSCSLWSSRGVTHVDNRSPVAIAAGSHPFPFRTRKLSPPAPMVLGGRPPGRVGRRRISPSSASIAGGARTFRRNLPPCPSLLAADARMRGVDHGRMALHRRGGLAGPGARPVIRLVAVELQERSQPAAAGVKGARPQASAGVQDARPRRAAVVRAAPGEIWARTHVARARAPGRAVRPPIALLPRAAGRLAGGGPPTAPTDDRAAPARPPPGARPPRRVEHPGGSRREMAGLPSRR